MKLYTLKTCLAAAAASTSVLLCAQIIPPTSIDNPCIIEFTSDATSGISTSKTYTHALNFGNDNAPLAINKVPFTNTSAAENIVAQYGWRGFPSDAHPGGYDYIVTDEGEQIRELLRAMNYNSASGTMAITGLEPGRCYEIRFYTRSWGAWGGREQTFTFKSYNAAEDAKVFDPDSHEPQADKILAYRYFASEAGELEIEFQATNPGSTYHLYGFSNEEAAGVRVDPVTDITDNSATLNGKVFTAGMGATVAVQFKLDDGAYSEAAWQGADVATAAIPSAFLADGDVAFATNSLAASTTYAFRFVVDNGVEIVPSKVQTFTTRGTEPVISSLAAEAVTGTSIVAKASVDFIAPGVAAGAVVEIFWGDNDGADDDGGWDNGPVIIGSTHGLGEVAHEIFGLGYATTNYYRHRVSYGGQTSWAGGSVMFTTTGMPAFGGQLAVPYSGSAYFRATLADAGAAPVTVALYVGASPDNLSQVKSWPATRDGGANFQHIIKGLANGGTCHYAFRAETEMPDAPGAPRHVWTPTASVTVVSHELDGEWGRIVWTGLGGDQRWGNPLNWQGETVPSYYQRAHIPAGVLPANDQRIIIDGPRVVGGTSGDMETRVAFVAGDPFSSLTLLSGSTHFGRDVVFELPVLIGNSGTWEIGGWEDEPSAAARTIAAATLHDFGLGLGLSASANQYREIIFRSIVDIGGAIDIQCRNGILEGGGAITNAAGIYLNSRLNDGGHDTTLVFDNSAEPRSNRLAPGVALGGILSGGSFVLAGNGTESVAENISLLDLQGGRLAISAQGADVGNPPATDLRFGAVSRGAGASLVIDSTNGGRVAVDGAANNGLGIWQPWAFRDGHYSSVGAGGEIIRVPDAAYIELAAAGNASGVLHKFSAEALTLAAPATIAGLRFSNALRDGYAQPQVLDLGAHDLMIVSGALIGDGNADKTIQSSGGGALVFSGDDVILNFADADAGIVIDAPIEWRRAAPAAPRPSLIMPGMRQFNGIRLSGEDRINDYEALSCYAFYQGALRSLMFDGPSDRTFHGPVSGTFIIQKYGSGSLRFNGENQTRQGFVTVYEGEVIAGHSRAPQISLHSSDTKLSIAEGVGYENLGETFPGATLAGFGALNYWRFEQGNIKPGTRIAPGDLETIGVLTFNGSFGGDGPLGDLVFDIKVNENSNDSVHVNSAFGKPATGSTWTFLLRDPAKGRANIRDRRMVLLDWTTEDLKNPENEFNLVAQIHPDSKNYLYLAADSEIVIDSANKQIVLTGLRSNAASLVIIR